jgi:uncharacterized membrane protein
MDIKSFSTSGNSMSRAEHRASFIMAGAAIIAAGLILASSSIILRSLAAVPLVFVLPGLSLYRAACGGSLWNLQTAATSVGLSMAVTVLSGFVLHLFGALSAEGWALMLCCLVTAASLLSLLGDRDANSGLPPRMRVTLPPGHWVMFGIAVAVALASIVLARSGAISHHQYAFTEFWMVPKGERGANIVTVGISNAENVATTYDIALFADDASFARKSGITLQPGTSWSEDVSINARFARAGRIQAWLFRADTPHDIYRKVWLSRPTEPATPAKEQ